MLPHIQAKSTIMEIFKYHNPLKDYHVKIYKIDEYFWEPYKEKIKCDKNGHEYMLFEIDNYFNGFALVVDVDGKEDKDENKYKDLIFELKRQVALYAKLGCDFIRINPKDLNHDIAYIQKFINEFNDNKTKTEIKELTREITKLNMISNVYLKKSHELILIKNIKTQNLNRTYANLLNIMYITMIPNTEVRSKINKIFRNHNPLEKYSVKIYKIDLYFFEQYEKYIKVDDNEREYILFKLIFTLVNVL